MSSKNEKKKMDTMKSVMKLCDEVKVLIEQDVITYDHLDNTLDMIEYVVSRSSLPLTFDRDDYVSLYRDTTSNFDYPEESS